MLPWGIGGGGTSGAMDAVPNGGDINAVLIDICGGAFGLRREGTDAFLGTGALLGMAVAPGGKYELLAPIDGLRPGCDDALLRELMPRLDTVLAGNVDAFSLLMLGIDASEVFDSVGEDAMVEEAGADILTRR